MASAVPVETQSSPDSVVSVEATKWCSGCQADMPRSAFGSADKARGRVQSACRSCHSNQKRSWGRRNRDYKAGQSRRREIEAKLEVIAYYSNSANTCSCYGADRLAFLTLDHIWGKNDPRYATLKHRGGDRLYSELRKTWPAGFRVMCFGCNQAVGHHEACAHQGGALPVNQYQTQRAVVLREYGGQCACCGESEPMFLTIEHLLGGGKAHREQMQGGDIYRQLYKKFHAGEPADTEHFGVLCQNCNSARGAFGRCCDLSNNEVRDWTVAPKTGFLRGSDQLTSKLTIDKVRLIRSLRGRRTNVSLAGEFGVSATTINNIMIGKTWADLGA